MAMPAGLRKQATMPPAPAEVVLDDVSFAYGSTSVLDGCSLQVGHHEVVALVGPSGCGKSTLLDVVCGLAEPTRGTRTAARAVLMPQRDALLPWATATDNAALGLRVAGVGKAEARDQARALLDELGLGDAARKRPAQLSGGMRQRVAFARTLLVGAPVICLDEPFGALDALTRTDLHAWLQRALEQRPRTVLLVTHDVEEAVVLADRVVVLSDRPARPRGELRIDLPRPRTATDPEVAEHRAQALELLR